MLMYSQAMLLAGDFTKRELQNPSLLIQNFLFLIKHSLFLIQSSSLLLTRLF